jgi:Druantia protein DruA
MGPGRIIQGRTVTADDIESIRTLIARHPGWHRTRLSQELCWRWDWVAANGRMKDMAARTLLRKLHAEDLITLPAPVRSANNAFRHRSPAPVALAHTAINGPLGELTPLQLVSVTDAPERRLFAGLLQRYHYLGYRGPVGENLQYLVYDRRGRVLSCVLFGAAAWTMASRDRFIGWERAERERNLALLANNMRFLIVPRVRVPHLASHILGRIARRIRRDWQRKYGHSLVLLETTVEQRRFAGTCYRAANWRCVGETRGRSRNDRYKQLKVPVKSVWLYPLTPQFRSLLCHPGE